MTLIRVALVDDHPVVLAGIRALLQVQDGLVLVGEASCGGDALRLLSSTMPDVAVIDISLPDMTGVELALRVRAAEMSVRLLALSVHEDRAYVQQLLQAGAKGYLLKWSAAEELVRAIRAIADGGIYLDPAVAAKAMAFETAPEAEAAAAEGLSPRERDVLRLIARGHSNKEIAARLQISIKTMETYKARAAEKLALRTRADIVRHGAAHGWLDDLEAS